MIKKITVMIMMMNKDFSTIMMKMMRKRRRWKVRNLKYDYEKIIIMRTFYDEEEEVDL